MLDAILGALLEVVLVGIFYWPGWLVLRTVTFGRYPPPRGIKHNEMFVAVVGLATPLATLTIVMA